MELVMSGLTYDVCLVYLDDILVFSKTFDEHLDRLATASTPAGGTGISKLMSATATKLLLSLVKGNGDLRSSVLAQLMHPVNSQE